MALAASLPSREEGVWMRLVLTDGCPQGPDKALLYLQLNCFSPSLASILFICQLSHYGQVRSGHCGDSVAYNVSILFRRSTGTK